ncbi:CTP synthase, partial [Candidatus Microgenomates bacterium]|nr:CTP synthase [Candidatus Microgenomates bacterium]
MKFIFITGGVVSGLGKGITAASLGLLLKSRGYKVTNVKADMYLNIDAGTIRPLEHGENFVTKDGLETDEDIGHYERFLGQDLTRANYITTGQIYQEVLRKERAMEYEGEDVEAIPHLTDEITRRIIEAGKKDNADIVITEFGGTITLQEIQNRIFIEASRIMKLKAYDDVVQIHVTYLPFVKTLGELKSKPAQTSVYILNSMGVQPDIVVARSEVPVDQRRLDRIALFTNTRPECIFSVPDAKSVYEVPLTLKNVHAELDELVLKMLKLPVKRQGNLIKDWEKMVKRSQEKDLKEITIAMVTKYYKSGNFDLSDSYVSVIEAIKHAQTQIGAKVNIKWVNSEGDFDLTGVDGVIVPQGWGSRGVEGKLKAVKYARENKIPYLGLCFGMQMAVIEFARNVLGLKDANSEEADPKTKNPVIHMMEAQKEYLAKHQYGGTIRLGAWPAVIDKKSKL